MKVAPHVGKSVGQRRGGGNRIGKGGGKGSEERGGEGEVDRLRSISSLVVSLIAVLLSFVKAKKLL